MKLSRKNVDVMITKGKCNFYLLDYLFNYAYQNLCSITLDITIIDNDQTCQHFLSLLNKSALELVKVVKIGFTEEFEMETIVSA